MTNTQDDSPLPNASSHAQRIDALIAHSDWIDRLAHRLVRDPNEADEVVQEAWVRAMESPPEDAGGNLKGWMGRVVRRVVSRRRRAALRRGDHEGRSEQPKGPKSPEQLASEVALQQDLSKAVLELPEAYRDVMLLRYFEDLPPRRIAKRLGIPINTVRSRLQRGAAALRSRLDEAYGSRRDWAISALPLALRAALQEGAASVLGLGVAGTVGAIAVIGGTAILVRAQSAPPGPRPMIEATAVTTQPEEQAEIVLAAPERQERRSAVPAPPAAIPEDVAEPSDSTVLSGVVLEVDGVPAPHVRMRRTSETTVRWQGGDRGWISGPGGSRRISAQDEERAREDATFARNLLRGLPERAEWRATLLDAPLPGRDERGDLEGTFAFESETLLSTSVIEVADPDWMQLAQGRRTLSDGASDNVWIAARSHRVEGAVQATDGTPITSGSVAAHFDVRRAIRALPFEFAPERRTRMQSVSIDSGAFLLRRVPVGAVLEVSAEGHATQRIEVTSVLPDPFEIRLRPLGDTETWRVHGVVTDTAGAVVAGALVTMGKHRANSDAGGRFELDVPIDAVTHAEDLVAVADGRGAARRLDLRTELRDGTASGRLELVLDDAQGEILGTLAVDESQRGAWRIALDDPTLLEFSFSSIEKRAMGRTTDVACSADGTFRVGGLFDRSYALRVWRPGTGAVHIVHDVRPGDTLTIDPSASLRTIEGRVENGAGARIAVIHRTFATASGEGGTYDGSAPVTCDGDGSFRMQDVPSEGAALRVQLADGAEFMVPVALIDASALEADGGLVLAAPTTCLLEVRTPHLAGEHWLAIEDASGRTLSIRSVMQPAMLDEVAATEGRFPLVVVPASARTAVVIGPDGTSQSAAFQTVAGGHVPVRVRP